MLKTEQLDQLPEILRDIVVKDRTLSVLRRGLAKPVVSFEIAKMYRRHRDARRELTEAAAHLWGYRLGGDGSATC
ncbi:hypothetical protein [Methylobacterium gnaphalii]|uniref:Uncharacterized protein n=1 Tax=Methylobacterium gnaphalii TaxID=1010610 RepID=A0A512JIT3_9HYPH|nr:hypothetical protein [Methylobacterium gnaphalii]GEP09833.1 hypothetical protein MGN01_16780 [Methylobacterium gnaphalii]GJD67252.1 hypothetical protein MMMDOFMJ_0166 [Methylobacterium gnaphalii]GLS49862.1 hypothetical protein GCM10007885_27140 [Methylobacterium gnaphalii]